MIFEYNSAKNISINIKELLKGQLPINNKFPNPNRGNKFVNIFDNMVGQIEEEIFETRERLYINKLDPEYIEKNIYQDEDSLEEFVDSIMYIGSLIIESANAFEIDLSEFLDKYNNLAKISISDFYVANDFVMAYRNFPNEQFLSFIRRKIYDRKYHKPASNKPDNYEEKFLINIIVGAFFPRKDDQAYATPYDAYKIPKFIDNMNPYMQDVLFCYDNDWHSDETRTSMIVERVATLNKIINKKQNKIKNL